jgi:hypothetical protein
MRPEGQAVTVDDKHLVGDGERDVATAAMALDAVPVGDGDVEVGPCLQLNARARCRLHIHEIMRGPRVQQCGEKSVVDVDVELHGPAGAWMKAGESMERYVARLGVGRQWHVFFSTYDLNDKQLFANLLVVVREHIMQ